MSLLLIPYVIAGYWATGKTIYADKIVIYSQPGEFFFSSQPGEFFFSRLLYGLFFGWALIPWALIKVWLSK